MPCATASMRQPVLLDGEQHGRRRQIFVEHIVVDELLVPEALAGVGVERQQAIGEQIRTVAVAAPEIRLGRFGGHVEDAALLIEREAGPVRHGAGRLVPIRRPGMVAVFARVRDRVEDPTQLAVAHVVGADGPGAAGESADDVQILVDHARCVDDYAGRALAVGDLDGGAEMDRAVLSKGGDQLAGLCVQGIEVGPGAGEDALVVAARPVDDTALPFAGLTGSHAGGVEGPDWFAGGGVQGNDFAVGRCRIEHSVEDQGVGLKLADIAGVVGPGDFQLLDVGFVDLVEGRVVCGAFVAQVDRPVVVGCGLRRLLGVELDEHRDERGEKREGAQERNPVSASVGHSHVKNRRHLGGPGWAVGQPSKIVAQRGFGAKGGLVCGASACRPARQHRAAQPFSSGEDLCGFGPRASACGSVFLPRWFCSLPARAYVSVVGARLQAAQDENFERTLEELDSIGWIVYGRHPIHIDPSVLSVSGADG